MKDRTDLFCRIFWDTNSLSHAHAIFWAQDDKFYVKQYSVDLYLNTVVSKSSCSVSSMGLNIENFCMYLIHSHFCTVIMLFFVIIHYHIFLYCACIFLGCNSSVMHCTLIYIVLNLHIFQM